MGGTLFGAYRKQDGTDSIDLTGHFSRADVAPCIAIFPFLPRPWSTTSRPRFGQTSNDVKLRLKVPLDQFRSTIPIPGLFRCREVTDAGFRYAEGWPAATGLTGDLIFEGKGNAGPGLQRASARRADPQRAREHPRLFHGNVHVGSKCAPRIRPPTSF